MSEQLPTHLLVGALLRGASDVGGSAMVLARGDPGAGEMLVITGESIEILRVFERRRRMDGGLALEPVSPVGADATAVEQYWQRRRARDPDLWVIELIVAGGERLTAEILGCC